MPLQYEFVESMHANSLVLTPTPFLSSVYITSNAQQKYVLTA